MRLADLHVFTEPQQGATYDDLLAVARRAESLGFGAFFRSDHYLKMGEVSGLPGPSDAWITLAGLARDTTSIRLGTMVTAATFRMPGPLAIGVAGVDQMSGGRVELGLGAGWYEAEHRAYGIRSPARRPLRQPRRPTRDHPGPVANAGGRDVLVHRPGLAGRRIAGPPEAGPESVAHRSSSGAWASAAPRRWQLAMQRSSTFRSPISTASPPSGRASCGPAPRSIVTRRR